MNTVLEITNVELLPTVGSDVYIPEGSLVDIQIGVSGWWLISQGKTLKQVSDMSGWTEALSSSGLQVQSTDTSPFSTDIIFHCVATWDVLLSNIDLTGHEVVVAYAGGGKIVSLA